MEVARVTITGWMVVVMWRGLECQAWGASRSRVTRFRGRQTWTLKETSTTQPGNPRWCSDYWQVEIRIVRTTLRGGSQELSLCLRRRHTDSLSLIAIVHSSQICSQVSEGSITWVRRGSILLMRVIVRRAYQGLKRVRCSRHSRFLRISSSTSTRRMLTRWRASRIS
jgi:hypothetical protein